MVQVGKAALHQRTHEVQHHGGALVAAEQKLRVGLPGGGGKFGAIDVIAAITGQADSVAGLLGGRARFGVLPGETADADHRLAGADHQHE